MDEREKVLLIDDDPAVGASLVHLLGGEFEVRVEQTGVAGIRRFEEFHPSLVVLDLKLPDQYGLDALKAIRGVRKDARVVILSAYATQETVRRSLELGALDCLSKPFDAAHLKAKIREWTHGTSPKLGSQLFPAKSWVEPDLETFKLAASVFLHDAASPLTSLTALAQMIQEQGRHNREVLAENFPEITALMTDTIGYLVSLVEQWRAFAQPESLPAEQVKLEELARLAFDLSKRQAEDLGVSLSMQVLPCPRTIYLNRHALARVLANLLQNALEAVSARQGRAQVVLKAWESDGGFIFHVKDNGPGIAHGDIEKIFHPGFTTKARGSGLGLYICKAIVEGFGGSISVSSQSGQGAGFTVQIPYR
jgi:signal transduction histidine kinase